MNLDASTSNVTLDSVEAEASGGADDRSLLVLYGSQTGTAQDTAELIGRAIRRHYIRAKVLALDDLDRATLLDESLIIFVCATTGQGNEPTNMKHFWRFLRRVDLPEDLLEGLNFSVFGLGDSSYPKFNWVAKKLHRRLEQLGAQCFYARGEADEQDYLGIDTALTPWLDGLLAQLLAYFPLAPGMELIPSHIRPPSRMRIEKSKDNVHTNGHRAAPNRTQWATLTRSDRATAPDHFQDTRYLVFDLDEDARYAQKFEQDHSWAMPHSWHPGDVLELRPENAPSEVELVLETLKWDAEADEMIHISATSEDQLLPHHWPRCTTLRELMTRYLDIFSVPRRSFFEFLSFFTTDEQETEKLREFCSPEGQEEMYDYAQRPRRTIAEVLQEFRSAQIPPEYMSDIFPEIRPRQFSIASSSRSDSRRVSLLVAIVNYRTKLRKPRQGVATSWLSRLKVGARTPVAFAPGSMNLPSERNTPIIAIGPGTGIAPFRSFVQERRMSQANDNLIFFGCRSRTKDFYYELEWASAQKMGELELFVAASRDQDDKIYVQHKLREQGNEVYDALKRGAFVYISGAANQMPNAVRKALADIVAQHGHVGIREAEAYIERLQTSQRLQEETWS